MAYGIPGEVGGTSEPLSMLRVSDKPRRVVSRNHVRDIYMTSLSPLT